MFTADENISELKGASKHLRTAANDAAHEAGHDLREAATRAGRKVRHIVDSAGEDLSHAKEVVTTQIRTHPMQSSLIALGVGVALGLILRR